MITCVESIGTKKVYVFQSCRWCGWNEAESIETYIDHCLNEHLMKEGTWEEDG